MCTQVSCVLLSKDNFGLLQLRKLYCSFYLTYFYVGVYCWDGKKQKKTSQIEKKIVNALIQQPNVAIRYAQKLRWDT